VSSTSESGAKHRGNAKGSVFGAVDAKAVDNVAAALTAAGYGNDQVEVVHASDVEGMETPLNRAGLRGLVGRFVLSLGDDLDQLEQIRQELAAGHVLVMVNVEKDEDRMRVRDILREHGGHSIRHYGHWTITSLD
jgi:hypothetical protein